MRKLGLFLVLFFTAAYSHAAYFGDFSSNSECSDVSGTWIPLYDGQALVILSGTFGSGTATVYTRHHDQTTTMAVPSSAQTSSTLYPIALGGGAEVCIALAGATAPALHWEINPNLVKDPNTGNLIHRYFSEEYD